MQRAAPPDDIEPHEFFTRWVPQAVAADPDRRTRLHDTRATIAFELEGEGGGLYALELADGQVAGRSGPVPGADLRVRVDVSTWRALNRGDLSAPEALLRRKLRVEGDFVLALKLHVILG